MARHRVVVLALSFILSSPAFAADLDAAREKITAAWATHTSMKAELTMDASIPTGQARLNLRGLGTVVWQKQEATEKYRIILTLLPPEPVLQRFKTEVLFDGETVYTTNEAAGATTTKTSLEESTGLSAPGGDLFLKQFEAQHSVTRLDDAKVRDRDVFVLEAIPDAGANEKLPYVRALHYVDQETGALLKAELFETTGVVTSTFTYTNFEWDVEVDENAFTPPTT